MDTPKPRFSIDDQEEKLIITVPTIDSVTSKVHLSIITLCLFFLVIVVISGLHKIEPNPFNYMYTWLILLLLLCAGTLKLVDVIWLAKGSEIIEISERQFMIHHRLFTLSKSRILIPSSISNFQVHLSRRTHWWDANSFWTFKLGRFTLEYQLNTYDRIELGFGDGLFENEAKALYQIILDRFPIYRPSIWKESKEA